MPTVTSLLKRRAAPPSRVKIAVPLPYWLVLMSERPSSLLFDYTSAFIHLEPSQVSDDG